MTEKLLPLGGSNSRMYEFIKVIDPVQALQELSMYVGGVLLQPTNPMIDISNDSIIQKKGFDKWSFRKKGENSK